MNPCSSDVSFHLTKSINDKAWFSLMFWWESKKMKFLQTEAARLWFVLSAVGLNCLPSRPKLLNVNITSSNAYFHLTRNRKWKVWINFQTFTFTEWSCKIVVCLVLSNVARRPKLPSFKATTLYTSHSSASASFQWEYEKTKFKSVRFDSNLEYLCLHFAGVSLHL